MFQTEAAQDKKENCKENCTENHNRTRSLEILTVCRKPELNINQQTHLMNNETPVKFKPSWQTSRNKS